MPLRMRDVVAPDLTLPPLYSAVRLREVGDALAHAIAIASDQGAGTLVHVGRFDAAEFALVLEPEEPLRSARRAIYAGMAALADALAAIAPPETAISIEWPDAVYVNWGLVGGGRLAWPQGARDDDVPPWLVFGAIIRSATPADVEPGAMPDITALDEEGFEQVTADQLIESFARNFMASIEAWREDGFDAVAKSYLQRVASNKATRREIDDNGDLLLHDATSAPVERLALLQRLQEPSWLRPWSKGSGR